MNAELIRDAAGWRLISLLFECPSAPGWREQVTALAAETGDAELFAAAEAAQAQAGEGLYHSIFGPGGPAPAREASYHDNIQLGYLMSELVHYYGAFAYSPLTQEAEDHVAVETGFIGFLRLKQAYAMERGDDESAGVTAEAARQFIEDHLSRMAKPLAEALAESGVSYLAHTSAALLRRTGPPRTLPVIPQAEIGDCEMTCGG